MSGVKVVTNPLKDMMASRKFLVHINQNKFKLEVEDSVCNLEKLESKIKEDFHIDYDFTLEYFDPDMEEYLELSSWKDLPHKKVVKLNIVEKISINNQIISPESIHHETSNELIICRENKNTNKMKLCLHPINYARMRKEAPNEYVPVLSFLGPTGAGKSSLLCKLKPTEKPIVALNSQPIPTTSNINSYLAPGFEDIKNLRLLDVEGEDGGLPLLEYCKSEGINVEELNLSAGGIVDFVKSVFANCDQKELNMYMNARKETTKQSFTRLAYTMSDVIIYVNTVPAKRESEYLERVLEFAEAAQKELSSVERPSLIMVFNQCNKREEPFDIDESTNQFFTLVDREKKLLASFRTVDFVKLPDWDHTALYRRQFTAFEDRLRQRIKEQRVIKREQGSLFSSTVWFNILEKIIENFEDKELSMSKIFSKFILSESSLVNRAYAFFDSIYGTNDKASFLRCREVAIKTLAVYILTHSMQKGHRDILENGTWTQLLLDLISQIERRTPCEARFQHRRCTQEKATHDVHRFKNESISILASPRSPSFSRGSFRKRAPSSEEITGNFYFRDPYSIDNLQQIFRNTIHDLKKLPNHLFTKERLAIFREGLASGVFAETDWSSCEIPKLPSRKCFICLENNRDTLLTCKHSFCSQCIENIKEEQSLKCPLCNANTQVINNIPPIRGIGGLRILSLDGGGFRSIVQVQLLQKLMKYSNLEIKDFFDIICGSGVSGILALCLFKCLSLDKCREIFEKIPTHLKQKPILEQVIGSRLYEMIFGSLYNSEEFEKALQEIFEDSDFLTLSLDSSLPKVFVVTGNRNSLEEPLLIGNYSSGKRKGPKVSHSFKLWEAARAASSIPSRFAPFEKDGEFFIDGSVFENNPSVLAVFEALNMYGYKKQVDLIISLGTGIKPSKYTKSENHIKYMNETIDLCHSSERVDKEIKLIFSDKYFRLNPEFFSQKDKVQTSTTKKKLQSLIRKTDEWSLTKEHLLKEIAERMLASVFVVESESNLFQSQVGEMNTFKILPRNDDFESKLDRNFSFFVEIEETIISKNPNIILSVDKHIIDATVTKEEKFEWTVTYKASKQGLFTCRVSIFFEGRKYDISGSPFLIHIVDEEAKPIFDIPEEKYLSFSEFMQSVPVSGFGALTESKSIEDHRCFLLERLEKLGQGSSLNSKRDKRDPSCLMKAVADQIFGTPKAHQFVRKCIAGWLRNNSQFILPDNSLLSSWAVNWDDYCDAMENDLTYGDQLGLVAISEFFGVRIIIVSSLEGPRFITDIKPTIFKQTKEVLLCHWGDFGYCTLQPWKQNTIFKPETKTPEPKNSEDSLEKIRKRTNSSPVSVKSPSAYQLTHLTETTESIGSSRLKISKTMPKLRSSSRARLNEGLFLDTPEVDPKDLSTSPSLGRKDSKRSLMRSSSSRSLKSSPGSAHIRRSKSSLTKHSNICLYPLEQIPHYYLDIKTYRGDQIHLLGFGYVICSYSNTPARIVTSIYEKDIQTIHFNQSSIICFHSSFPWVTSYHSDGMIQTYNVEERFFRNFSDLTQAEEEPKPQCLLTDKHHIVLVSTKSLKIWNRDNMSKSPRIISLEHSLKRPLFSIQQKLSQLRYPQILIATRNAFQIWDISQNGELFYEGRNNNSTSSYLHICWVDDVVMTFTSSTLTIFNFQEQKEIEISLNNVITSVFADKNYLVTGDKDGLLTLRDLTTGNTLYDLNCTTQICNQEQEDFSHSINKIQIYYTKKKLAFVYAAHQNNKMTLWDLNLSNQENPLYDCTTSNPVKNFVGEKGKILGITFEGGPSNLIPTLIFWNTKPFLHSHAKELLKDTKDLRHSDEAL